MKRISATLALLAAASLTGCAIHPGRIDPYDGITRGCTLEAIPGGPFDPHFWLCDIPRFIFWPFCLPEPLSAPPPAAPPLLSAPGAVPPPQMAYPPLLSGNGCGPWGCDVGGCGTSACSLGQYVGGYGGCGPNGCGVPGYDAGPDMGGYYPAGRGAWPQGVSGPQASPYSIEHAPPYSIEQVPNPMIEQAPPPTPLGDSPGTQYPLVPVPRTRPMGPEAPPMLPGSPMPDVLPRNPMPMPNPMQQSPATLMTPTGYVVPAGYSYPGSSGIRRMPLMHSAPGHPGQTMTVMYGNSSTEAATYVGPPPGSSYPVLAAPPAVRPF